ncbi:hypothetical protein GGF37_003516 [Kickxella alabastrina]|nr:hypothetical protein GGF37_003516 [Kickxella alabastrina]
MSDNHKSNIDNNDSGSGRDLFSDLSEIFDMALAPALFPGRMDPVHQQDVLWEPPYAQLLRRLGLFDPLELPPKSDAISRHGKIGSNSGRGASTFPVAAYSARASQQMPQQQDDKYQLGYPRDDAGNGHLIGTIGEVFGDTTRWAVGNLFGHLRDAMDRIERKVHDVPQQSNGEESTQSLYRALRSDLISNFDRLFPEPSDSEKRNCRYYHVSTYTMPDGSVETRKVVRNKDGSETTTVTRHGRDSTASDQVTATTTPALTPGDLSSAK